MKKIILVMAVSLFAVIGCYSGDVANAKVKDDTLMTGATAKALNPNVSQSCYEDSGQLHCCMIIKSNNMEDGDVNSLFIPNVLADGHTIPMKLGREMIEGMPVDYRTLLSFDTNYMPKNVHIDHIYLQAAFDLIAYNEAIPYETVYESVMNNLVLDFNTLTGFGGSAMLTGMDMYGYQLNRIAIGDMEYPELPLAYLNPNGKTQIRLGFIDNPYEVYYHVTGHVYMLDNDRPRLEITWSEDL